MMIPSFLMSTGQRKMMQDRRKQEVARRLPLCIPWDPEMKYKQELNIVAKTYKTRSLFDVPTTCHSDPNFMKVEEGIYSPKESFCYCEVQVPRGTKLDTCYGREQGSVLFDGPVIIPKVHGRDPIYDNKRWDLHPWMSLTPMELFTLRPGTKRAKGSVIVAGLGLGHQLIEVSKRKQVTKLVLIEKSKELVDWILPRVKPYLVRELDDVVTGDAYEVMPKMQADVALVDIFKSYGSNDYERDKLRQACVGIDFIWAWGASSLRERGLW
jgi:hypothetical protein